jgi:hypothetical protein
MCHFLRLTVHLHDHYLMIQTLGTPEWFVMVSYHGWIRAIYMQGRGSHCAAAALWEMEQEKLWHPCRDGMVQRVIVRSKLQVIGLTCRESVCHQRKVFQKLILCSHLQMTKNFALLVLMVVFSSILIHTFNSGFLEVLVCPYAAVLNQELSPPVQTLCWVLV